MVIDWIKLKNEFVQALSMNFGFNWKSAKVQWVFVLNDVNEKKRRLIKNPFARKLTGHFLYNHLIWWKRKFSNYFASSRPEIGKWLYASHYDSLSAFIFSADITNRTTVMIIRKLVPFPLPLAFGCISKISSSHRCQMRHRFLGKCTITWFSCQVIEVMVKL